MGGNWRRLQRIVIIFSTRSRASHINASWWPRKVCFYGPSRCLFVAHLHRATIKLRLQPSFFIKQIQWILSPEKSQSNEEKRVTREEVFGNGWNGKRSIQAVHSDKRSFPRSSHSNYFLSFLSFPFALSIWKSFQTVFFTINFPFSWKIQGLRSRK